MDMGHVLLILALVIVVFMAVRRTRVSFDMCMCPPSSPSGSVIVASPKMVEAMSSVPDCGEMCSRLETRDAFGFDPSRDAEVGVTIL